MEHKSLYSYYLENDTLYFEKNRTDSLDTIIIDALDIFENQGSFTSISSKALDMKINDFQLKSKTPQTLLFILYDCSGHLYNMQISFRDFVLSFEKLENYIKKDSLLKDLNLNNYYMFERNSDVKLSPLSVTKIIWTKEYGLTRYYLNNGDYFEIKIRE